MNILRRCPALPAVALALLFASPAWGGESFRCGSKIISVGMSMSEVREHCGEPDAKEVIEQDVRSGSRVVGKTYLHVWTYESPTTYPRVLEFDQDKLMNIR